MTSLEPCSAFDKGVPLIRSCVKALTKRGCNKSSVDAYFQSFLDEGAEKIGIGVMITKLTLTGVRTVI